ncbi:MAG: hypothetical protein ACE5RJ_00570 [Nitrosopumilaceae archaeon]
MKKLRIMLDEMNVKYEVIDVTEKPEYLEKYPIYTAPGIILIMDCTKAIRGLE